MAKSPFLAALAVVVAASTLTFAQQTTPPPTPPAKPTPTAKPSPTAKPTPAPAKSGTAAKPAASPTPTATPAPPPPPPPKPATDVKLKTQYQQGAQVSENVMYVQGPRQRVEFPGVVSIDQCDLKRSVMLNASDKKYRVQPYPEGTAAPAPQAPAPQPLMGGPTGQAQPGGVLTMTTTLTDTLEREKMFGLEARHVKSVMVKEPSSRACDKQPLKVEVDAWYVDLPEQSKCVRPNAAPPPPPPDPAACTDRVETRTVGDVKLGFPVKVTTTTTSGEGDKLEVTTSSQAVTELEITHLDKALFEVPAGYTEANSTAEIVPAVGNGGLADAVFGSTADGTSMAAPKKAGVVRIGVLEPVNHTDRNLSGRFLRQDVVAKLNKGSFDALPLAGTSPAEIQQEAAKLQCDYILSTDITEVKTSKPGGIGGAMKKVSGGGDNKDKQDVKLDYKLFAVDATQAPKLSGKAQASTGGFGVGSALKMAAFAGQMYMSVMGMGGLTNSMMGLSGLSGMGGGMGMYDPRMSAMASMAASVGMSAMAGGGGAMGGDASEQDMRNTVSAALGNAAKATMDQLSNTKKK